MGLNIEYLSFFDQINKIYSFKNKQMVALGSQEMHDPKAALEEYAKQNNYVNFGKTFSVRYLLMERYGLAEYTDLDFNDSADIKIDFSLPLPEEYNETCDIVLDGGTSEHIFDIANVFKNMHDLLRPGGIFIHMSPYTWMEHGFYNFNAKFFHFLDKANNYTPLMEGFYFQHDLDAEISGIQITHINAEKTKIAELINADLTNQFARKNILYLRVSRKDLSAPFVIPYDVYD